MKWKKAIERKTGMKEIIIQIEDDGDTQDIAVLRLFVDEKQADSIIDVLNDYPALLKQKAALLAACKVSLEFLKDINKGHVQRIQLESAIKAGEA